MHVRVGVAGRTQDRMDGERKTPVRSAVAAWEGRRAFPPESNRFFGDSVILNGSKRANSSLLLSTEAIKIRENDAVEYNQDKVDEMTLALLSLTMSSDKDVTLRCIKRPLLFCRMAHPSTSLTGPTPGQRRAQFS